MSATLSRLRRSLPILGWLPRYGREDARGDLIAGITVGVVLIPKGMAFAVLAGMPPIYGLYASLVPLLIYPLLGSSRHMAVGLNAVPMLLVAAGVGSIAVEGTASYIRLAILVTAIAGLIELGMAALRLGFLANLLSRPVIAGFTAATALIIMSSQLGPFIGVELERSQYLQVVIFRAAAHLADIDWITLAIAASSFLVILGLHRWKPLFPAELVVLAGTTLVVWALHLDRLGVATVGDIPRGLPAPAVPAFSVEELRALLPTAIAVAMINFMSVVSLGRIFAARHRYSIDANQELLALGGMNVLGSFFRCLPGAGSFSRTAINEQAGARTPMANAVTAMVVGLALLFLTPLFRDMPLAALAAIIMVAGLSLIDPAEVRYLFRTKRVDGWVALVTFVATLVIGVADGLLLGIAAATVAVLYRQSRPHVAELGHLSATRSFKNVERFAKAYPIEGLVVLRIEAGFSFFNAQFMKDYILEKADRAGVRAIVLDAGSVNDLDTTAVEALEEVTELLEERGVEIHFAGLTGPVRDVMRRGGLGAILGPDRFHLTPDTAVRDILGRWDRKEGTRRLELYERSTELDEGVVEPTAGSDLT